MAKNPYDCSYCGMTFERSRDHMSHVVEVHDVGFVPRAERTSMPHLRCWRCAAEAPRCADGTYACEKCGFVIPRKEEVQQIES